MLPAIPGAHLLTCVVQVHEVDAHPGPCPGRGIGPGRMRRSETEEHDATGFQFAVNGVGFVDVGADVVIAVGIPLVQQFALVHTGNDLQRAVLPRRVVDGDPHGATPDRSRNAEIGVVGVPVGAHAVAGRLVEHLVEDLHHRVAEQGGHRRHYAGMEGQGAEQPAMGPKGDKLQVALAFRYGHVARQAGDDPAVHLPLQRGGLVRCEEAGNDGITRPPCTG